MYAELHVKTNFSFLEGASHPDELVGRAAELGYAALAVTDRQSLAGVVRAHVAAKEAGLKLLVGAEVAPDDGLPLVLLPTDRASYGRLARLLTRGRLRAEKGQCRLLQSDLAEAAEGLIACVIPQNFPLPLGEEQGARGTYDRSATLADAYPRHPGQCASENPLTPTISRREREPDLPDAVRSYRELFGDRCYLLAEVHRSPDDRQWLRRLVELSRRTRVPLAAGGDVHYHVAGRKALHDVLTATRLGTTVAGAAGQLFPNAQRHLKTPEEMAAALADAPGAVQRTREIADRVGFSLDQLRYEYPRELAPEGESPIHYLARLAWAGARKRYPRGVPEKVRGLLEHELRLIEELRYEAYFLTVWDLVRYARRRGILCQGRGSAANSAVCYCLGVTAVDPERIELLFERFVSRQRNEAPDIDVDFEHQRREEVLQYVYRKYGRDRAGMTAEVITYRPRSAIRDVGKALGLPPQQIDRLAKNVEHFREEPQLALRCREAGIDPEGETGLQFVNLVGQLIGFPRHLSQHTGGMVITAGPLCELVPIENAAMPGRTVIQWNKDDLDELGILKVDCLALGMLTAVRRCFDLVRKHYGRTLTLAAIPEGDEAVYAMIRRADTRGVFQIESRAQMSMLPRLRPRSFYDLVIEVAIVRPGPIQGNMVHPYLRRRNGQEPVTYPNEAIRRVLEKTLGVPLFQEQAMRLAVVAAGFTPGEADQLRRAMAAWRRPGLIEQFRRKLIDGMLARDMPPEYAEATFQQIRGFGDYGFPESHAASFALVVYVSAWLKCHYPAAFCAALLNSQPMGFYAPPQLVRDARQHGVEVRPADVNYSRYECTLEAEAPLAPAATPAWRPGLTTDLHPLAPAATPAFILHPSSFILPLPALRLGLQMLQGMGEAPAGQIVETRGQRPFGSLEDFTQRTGLGRAVALRLAKAGAFGSLGLDRRGALWHALAHDPKDRPQDRPLLAGLEADGQTPAGIPPLAPAEEVLADYRTTGLSLRAHPLEFLRAGLDRLGVAPARQLATLPNGGSVRVAGIVLVRQRPSTAKGITFVTLEDETGVANLVIRPDVWQRFRQAALGATVLMAGGRLERYGQVIHVLVGRLEDLSPRLAELGSQSRDFC